MLNVFSDPRVYDVVAEVFSILKVEPFLLTGDRRDRQASRVRAVIAGVLRTRYGFTLGECAEVFERDPSAISRLLTTHDLFVTAYINRHPGGDNHGKALD
jgi:hypothetical protein